MPETLVVVAWLRGMRLFGPLDTNDIILEQKYAMVRAKSYNGVGHSGSGPPHRPSPSPALFFGFPLHGKDLARFPASSGVWGVIGHRDLPLA